MTHDGAASRIFWGLLDRDSDVVVDFFLTKDEAVAALEACPETNQAGSTRPTFELDLGTRANVILRW